MGRSMGHWHWQYRPNRAVDRLPLFRWPRADRQAAALHSPEAPVSSMCNRASAIVCYRTKEVSIRRKQEEIIPWWEKMSPCEWRLMVDGPVVMETTIWKNANRPTPTEPLGRIFNFFYSFFFFFFSFFPGPTTSLDFLLITKMTVYRILFWKRKIARRQIPQSFLHSKRWLLTR